MAHPSLNQPAVLAGVWGGSWWASVFSGGAAFIFSLEAKKERGCVKKLGKVEREKKAKHQRGARLGCGRLARGKALPRSRTRICLQELRLLGPLAAV
jgi:hypothetical protein